MLNPIVDAAVRVKNDVVCLCSRNTPPPPDFENVEEALFGCDPLQHFHASVILLCGDDPWAEVSIRALRRSGIGTPLLVLRTERGSRSASQLYDAGADSCLPLESAPDEHAAVARALKRRGPSVWEHGAAEVELSTSAHTLRIGADVFKFGPVSFKVVRYLVENRSKWVSQLEIIQNAMCTNHGTESAVARVQIHQIRKILGRYRDCIVGNGRRGCGYMFSVPRADPGTLTHSQRMALESETRPSVVTATQRVAQRR